MHCRYQLVNVCEDRTMMVPLPQLFSSGLQQAGPPITTTTLARLREFADSPTAIIIKRDIE